MELKKKSTEPAMAALPPSWKTLPDGTPAPNWVAAVDEARRDIDLDLAEAAKGLRGTFAHVAPDVSLADDLIADGAPKLDERGQTSTPRERRPSGVP